jgi:hypothetical protein
MVLEVGGSIVDVASEADPCGVGGGVFSEFFFRDWSEGGDGFIFIKNF